MKHIYEIKHRFVEEEVYKTGFYNNKKEEYEGSSRRVPAHWEHDLYIDGNLEEENFKIMKEDGSLMTSEEMDEIGAKEVYFMYFVDEE